MCVCVFVSNPFWRNVYEWVCIETCVHLCMCVFCLRACLCVCMYEWMHACIKCICIMRAEQPVCAGVDHHRVLVYIHTMVCMCAYARLLGRTYMHTHGSYRHRHMHRYRQTESVCVTSKVTPVGIFGTKPSKMLIPCHKKIVVSHHSYVRMYAGMCVSFTQLHLATKP